MLPASRKHASNRLFKTQAVLGEPFSVGDGSDPFSESEDDYETD